MHLSYRQLIIELRQYRVNQPMAWGWGHNCAHSYQDKAGAVALIPTQNVTIAQMTQELLRIRGKSFACDMGQDCFALTDETPVFFARYGFEGDALSPFYIKALVEMGDKWGKY